jgi:threonine/homoserine/homoserine lactone efflux protein
MDSIFFLKGLVIGFVIAAPLGPIGILCGRRTLTCGWQAGFLSGMGASTADMLYGFIAAFGLTFISDIILSCQFWFRLAGGVILCFIGVRIFRERPDRKALVFLLEKERHHTGMYTSTFFLALTNPLTIFSLAAVFAGAGIAGTRGNFLSASVLVLGVFLGSVLWWLFIGGVFRAFKKRFKRHELQWINRIAGLIIAVSGCLALASLLYCY